MLLNLIPKQSSTSKPNQDLDIDYDDYSGDEDTEADFSSKLKKIDNLVKKMTHETKSAGVMG
jgi:hypothetical protein